MPTGVELVVSIVIVVLHVGVQPEEEKEAVAPAGNPDTLNDIGAVVPETSVAATASLTVEPCFTESVDEPAESEKRNGDGMAGAVVNVESGENVV